jgi:hypothetical protein
LHKQRREITSLRGALPSVDPDKILKRVARKYASRPTALGCAWRKGAASKQRGDVDGLGERYQSLREIGEVFAGLDYAAVAQRSRRTRSTQTVRAKSNLIAEMLNV